MLAEAFAAAVEWTPGVRFDAQLKEAQLRLRAEGVELGISLRAVNRIFLGRRFLGDGSKLLLERLGKLGLDASAAVRKGGSYGRKDVAVDWLHANVVKPLTADARCALIDFFLGLRVAPDDEEEEALERRLWWWRDYADEAGEEAQGEAGEVRGEAGEARGEGAEARGEEANEARAAREEGEDRAAVGRMDVFHSYAWGSGFKQTHATLRANCPASEHVYLWWDLFCQNQHEVGDVGATFDHAMRQAKVCLFSIQDTHDEMLALGRIWCLFEATAALRHGTTLCIMFLRQRSDALTDYLHERAEWERQFEEIDVRHAEATVEHDRVAILDKLEQTMEGGVAGVNTVLREHLIAAYRVGMLATAARTADFGALEELAGGGLVTPDHVRNFTLGGRLETRTSRVLAALNALGIPAALGEQGRALEAAQRAQALDSDDNSDSCFSDSDLGGDLYPPESFDFSDSDLDDDTSSADSSDDGDP
jgi:hypothetical protein